MYRNDMKDPGGEHVRARRLAAVNGSMLQQFETSESANRLLAHPQL